LKKSAVAPVGATPNALMAITFFVLGLYINACVSPPQLSTSHMVQVAANIAHEASTALPPLLKMIAPAVAASGFPVIAIQCLPWSGGFCVLTGRLLNDWAINPFAKPRDNIKSSFIFIFLKISIG
jgi:hypothetical protein